MSPPNINPAAMHLDFYVALNDPERRLYHNAVATALAQLIEQQTNPSDEIMQAAAYHYHVCGEGLSEARHHLMAAMVCFANDDFKRTTQLCLLALTTMRDLDAPVPVDVRLRVDSVYLLLLSIEGLIRVRPPEGEVDQLDLLITDAENVAAHTDEMCLRAKAKLLRAKFTLYVRGLGACIPIFEEAYQLACESGDDVIEFLTTADLGFYVVGQDLRRGLQLMEDAHRLFETKIKDAYFGRERPQLERSYYHLKGRIGVVKFDKGDYKEALEWLDASYARLRESNLSPVNFYCQPYTAMGLFEEAEAMLKADIDLSRNEEELNAFLIYNLSLLGKLYLEWGRIQDAAHYLTKSWTKAKALELSWLVTLVGNYHTELLMHEQFSARDLDAAATEAEMVAEIARTAGWHRSVVTALSLRGRIALAQGQIETAVRFSQEAVDYLRQWGLLPATRSEEIYFTHYNILKAAGRDEAAEPYLREAYQTLLDKLNSINDDRYRQSMMRRVALNHTILTAAKAFLN
jgi:tetratricopeptide (TPR) repeat protein